MQIYQGRCACRGEAAVDTKDSFGYWVRRRRKALDLTQAELARCVGCAVITLRKIEADGRRPSRQMAERLAQCLRLSVVESAKFISAASGEKPLYTLETVAELKSLNSASSLPVPTTRLIGRSEELAAIVNCLRRKDVRLHTLTGPVGVGKTRLAIEAGLRLQHEFRHGVFLVGLAPVQDPALVPTITATVLGIRVINCQNLVSSILDYLAHKEILLIFDNFEHLQPAAGFLSDLLQHAPSLRILVTSRAVLHLYGEHEYGVLPMLVPSKNNSQDNIQAACVRLFCERAQAVQADFQLSPELLPVVTEICRRLDGLPLAIELAAARIKLFSPLELLQRLEKRLPAFAHGPTDQQLHDQVLENAIAWSYGLLQPCERTLLNRLAVFRGGFTLAAAEAVCGLPYRTISPSTGCEITQDMPDMANGLAVLQDQSLLLRLKGKPAFEQSRYYILETICEFSLRQLQASGEYGLQKQRCADYFIAWVELAETYTYGPDRASWLTWFELESENLRASLNWCIAAGQMEKAALLAQYCSG